MRENKLREPSQPSAKGATLEKRRKTKPRRLVAIGDVAIPKKGVWAGEECLVLDVEKRPQRSGYFQVVCVLLPNQRQRLYPLVEIKEIVPGKGAIVTKPRQQGSDAKTTNEKSTMKVIMKHVSGSAKANLEYAKEEITRVLGFRGDVVSAKVQGSDIIVEIVISPKWDAPLQEKVSYLKGWIPAKAKVVFKVVSVSAAGEIT